MITQGATFWCVITWATVAPAVIDRRSSLILPWNGRWNLLCLLARCGTQGRHNTMSSHSTPLSEVADVTVGHLA
jgi:hypothetical protein